MPNPLGGVGLTLPLPQALYPINPGGAAPSPPTNKVALGPAEVVVIPAGTYLVSVTGTISALQWYDPIRQEWVNLLGPGAAWAAMIRSDGVNFRVANLSDWWFTGIVTAAGTGYVQSSTSVTAATGNSVWQPIVGGALGTFTVVTGGSNYTKPPIVFLPSPPPPGIAATATAALTAGAVSGITIRIAGAGYTSAPPVTLITDPSDPALGIVPATATVATTGSGTVTGLLLVSGGQLLTTAPTLTVNGVGASATATTSPATVVAAANDTLTLQAI